MWWASLLGGLVSLAGSLTGRVLIALGIGFVSYTGISTGIDAIHTQVAGFITGQTGMALNLLGRLKVDVCINILFSALTARMALAGLASGAIKKMVVK